MTYIDTTDGSLIEAPDITLNVGLSTAWEARRALWRVVLPQTVPSIALGMIVVFALVLVEIAVPMFLRVDVYSAAVFVRLGGFAFAPGEAAILTLPLVVLSFLLWTAEQASPARRVIALPATRSVCIPSMSDS